MGMAGQTHRLAQTLGLTGEQVFFHETWVPYADRQNWLLDADAGVTTHFEHVETTFAFRTRLLDYLWAGLPSSPPTATRSLSSLQPSSSAWWCPPEIRRRWPRRR